MPQETLAVATSVGADGGGAQYEPPVKGKGYIDDAVFDDIAEAIRERNGETTRYKPREMAPAILGLRLLELKARALLLDDGTLELTYLTSKASPSGGQVEEVLDVPETAGVEQSPWYEHRRTITRVLIDESFKDCHVTGIDHWFEQFKELKEISGMENMPYLRTIECAFASCGKLETIYAAAGYEPAIESGKKAFQLTHVLVGGEGAYGDDADDNEGYMQFCHGPDGLLTDPEDDHRDFVHTYLYEDGDLVFTRETEPEADRETICDGRFVMKNKYTILHLPYYEHRSKARKAIFDSSLRDSVSEISMYLWFSTMSSLEAIEGLANLTAVVSMNGAFRGCSSLQTIDLSGFDASRVEDYAVTFAGCSSLRTIYVDTDWTEPEGNVSPGTFTDCDALQGGLGSTIHDAGTDSSAMRIDAPGLKGLLTVKL